MLNLRPIYQTKELSPNKFLSM